MNFKKVIGQQTVAQSLKRAVDNQRLPHALLLLGKTGSGNLALAIALAKYVLCKNKGEEDSCGVCNNCKKVTKYIHPDLHFAFPVVGTKMTSDHFLTEWREAIAANPYLDVNDWLEKIGAENKQGNISKDECNNIIKKLSLKTFEDSWKIQIIWLPEYLGKEGNRLLKLIEEPPAQTLFILVVENTEMILNTILSRCQIFTLSPLREEDITHHLIHDKNIAPTLAQQVALLADGNYNQAIKLAQTQQNDDTALFLEWLRAAYRGNGVQIVDLVGQLAKLGRENQKRLFQYGLHFLRELLMMKFAPNATPKLLDNEHKAASNLSAVLTFDKIEKLVTLLNDTHYYVIRNANPKILFLDASIQMNQIMRSK